MPYGSLYRPTLAQVAVTLSLFALFFAAAMFWPLATDNLDFKRTHATAWAMTLLATPAFYIFARTYGDDPLTNWWRLSWTAGWAMALVHLYFGLFDLHDGDPVSVFQRQGWLLAGTIFLLMIIWSIDILNAWFRPDWREDDIRSRRPAFWVGAAAFFVSTVLFNNDIPSLVVGLMLTGALIAATLARIDALEGWDQFFRSEATVLIVAILAIVVAFFGPTFLSTAETTNSMTADLQAKWTAWPTIFLGGIATAILIAVEERDLEDWGWAHWQLAGLAAYGTHVYAGYFLVFDGSFAAMVDKQGMFVAVSNLVLLIVWSASAYAGVTDRDTYQLHIGATLLFVASGVLSAVFMGGAVVVLIGVMALVWLAVAFNRFADI